MDYNIWFVVGDSSVSLYVLIPQYGYLASFTCFYWFWHMFVPVFLSNCSPISLHMLKCSCAHTFIMSFYVLLFCQYWACWYYVVYCLIKLLAKSAYAICLCVQYFCRVLFCSYAWCCAATISLSVSAFRSPFDNQRNVVVSVADPMRNVSWMLFPGGTELGTQVKTGSRAGRTHTQ